jgi:hypothetical protein
MDAEQVIGIFREAGAVLEGHFILTSGLRSPVFLQKARVLMHADKTEILCRALARQGFGGSTADCARRIRGAGLSCRPAAAGTGRNSTGKARQQTYIDPASLPRLDLAVVLPELRAKL